MPDHWLEAWADCGRLFSKWHAGVPFEFPEIELNEGLKDDNVRTTSILRFKDSLQTNLPKWNIPTNLIGYPLIDFIAARDIARLLKKSQFVQNLKMDPLPDQFSCWSEYATPFGKILALPMANSSNFVSQLGARLVSLENTNLQSHRLCEFGWDEEHSAFEWKGLPPIVFPHMIPVSGTNGEYALLKLFPNKPRPSKARPELFAEVFGKPNLVYYEWEITSEHLGQWWNLLSLYSALRRVPVGDAEAPAFKWINAMAKRAGNTVTEAVITGPRELTLTRKSPLGFTGTELALFLRQENGPGFPLHSVDEIETIVIPSGGAQFIPANGGRPAAAPGH